MDAGDLSGLKPIISPLDLCQNQGFLCTPLPPTFYLREHSATGLASGQSPFGFCAVSFATRNGGGKTILPK